MVHGAKAATSSCSLARATEAPNELGLAERVDAVHGEHVLGEIDADEYDSHGLPLSAVS
jgi:hypothetical protein